MEAPGSRHGGRLRTRGAWMAGKLLRQPPVARRPNPLVLHAIHPLDRPHLEYALTAELSCVYYPTFPGPSAERRLRIDLPDSSQPLGDLETPAFLWLNYLRWRLMRQAAELRRFGPLPFAVCAGLAARARAAAEVRDRIVRANCGLVGYMVRLRGAGAPDLGEIESTAYEVLVRCVNVFDTTRGRFSTFACIAMSNELVRRRHREIKHRQRNVPCLDEQQLDRVAGPPDPAEDQIDARQVRRLLRSRKVGLSRTEQLVLRRRFGLNGHGEQTLDQIGPLIGVTKERVRQIQLQALGKLRAILDPQ